MPVTPVPASIQERMFAKATCISLEQLDDAKFKRTAGYNRHSILGIHVIKKDESILDLHSKTDSSILGFDQHSLPVIHIHSGIHADCKETTPLKYTNCYVSCEEQNRFS